MRDIKYFVFAFLGFLLIGLVLFFFFKPKNGDLENFETFYEEFVTDSLFQISRINFPLEGLPEYANEEIVSNGYFWQASEWIMHKKVDYAALGFERNINKVDDYLVVETYRNDENLGIVRRFKIDNNKWYLIYYASINQMKPKE